ATAIPTSAWRSGSPALRRQVSTARAVTVVAIAATGSEPVRATAVNATVGAVLATSPLGPPIEVSAVVPVLRRTAPIPSAGAFIAGSMPRAGRPVALAGRRRRGGRRS